MTSSRVTPNVRWFFASVVLLALLFGAVAPAGAQDDFGHATITLYAPGAPAGAWVSVQWQNQAGNWSNVEGWQGPVQTSSTATDTTTDDTDGAATASSSTPFKQ